MYGIDILVEKILLLAILVIIGVIIKRKNIVTGGLAKGFSDTVVYVSQPAMIIYSFTEATLNKTTVFTSLTVLVFALIFHFGFYCFSKTLYKNAPENKQIILRFSTVFTNAGFLGMPLISELISPTAAMFASFYVMAFNIYNWSLGCYMYTDDRSYISPKKMFINPATVPTYIGIAILILKSVLPMPTGFIGECFTFTKQLIVDDALFLLKSTVLPLSMIMIGIRLADSKLGDAIKDKYVPVHIITRLLMLPIAVMLIMKGVSLIGIFDGEIVKSAAIVLTICAATPAAAMASIFAERFGGDTAYAGKTVSMSTAFSLITMPIVSTLLTRIF